MNINDRIASELKSREDNNSLRSLAINNGIDFSSNDYLGLARLRHKLEAVPSGSGGSRLLSGNYSQIEELESELANHGRTEAALIFGSGYAANLGLFSCVCKRGDIILYDQLVHASIRDGIRMSNAAGYSFIHNDYEALEILLKKHQGENVFVAIESVYSMDGDNPKVESLKKLKTQYNFNLIVDEAHSFGLMGEKGAGWTNHYELNQDVFAKVITFGKAMGCDGAAILGSANLRKYLINFSRPFIYTTAPSPHKVALMQKQFNIIQSIEDRNKKANQLKHQFITNMKGCGTIISGDFGNIVGLIIGGNDKTRAVSEFLQKKKLVVKAILSPTVPEGSERLRICFHEYNTQNELELLIQNLKEALEIY
jgi:8-amino-7-oxononanoate synthase